MDTEIKRCYTWYDRFNVNRRALESRAFFVDLKLPRLILRFGDLTNSNFLPEHSLLRVPFPEQSFIANQHSAYYHPNQARQFQINKEGSRPRIARV